jgi:hypothetical protein
MSKLPLVLPPTAFVSKLDRCDWSREQWRLAYGMARRMIRHRDGRTLGEALTWYRDHAIRRFGAGAYRMIFDAGFLVLARRTACHALTGSIEELARQGLIRPARKPRPGNLCGVVAHRCVRFERIRAYGLNYAWGWDPLLAAHFRRSCRVELAQHRRKAAAGWYALTSAGVAALQAAGLIEAREAAHA